MSERPPQSHESPYPPKGSSRETFEANRFGDVELQKVHSQLMREKAEPAEGFTPMPLFLVFVIMMFSFWAGIYMVNYSGGFSAYHFNERASSEVAVAEAPREVDIMALGQRVYVQNCQLCHQASGAGQAGVYPPVMESDWVQDNPDRLIKVVLHGLEGQVTINGNAYNNAMTAFGRLSDQQVAAVLTYLRTGDDFANDSYPVTEEEVATVRAEYGDRRSAWTQPELEAIHGPVTGEWAPAGGEAPAEGESANGAEADSESEAVDTDIEAGIEAEGDAGQAPTELPEA